MVSLLVDFAFVLMIVLLAILTPLLVLEVILSKKSALISNQLESIEKALSEYRSFEKYLRRRESEAYREQLGSVLESIRLLETHPRLISVENRARTASFRLRVEELITFLEQFVSGYTKEELKRRADFFAGKSLDIQQSEAVVKNDAYNLVIAAAGSGKTRTLTARLAYLIKCGIAPDKILALAYTNAASREMRDRLQALYGLPNVEVRTFHSFGRKLARKSPNFRNDVARAEDQRKLVDASVERLAQNKEFAMRFLNFAIDLRESELEEKDFSNIGKYYEYLRNQRYKTLNFENVKSIAERDIANFLFLHNVKYEYEARAAWADSSPKFRRYHPDFYLPDYDIWIEHFGIDRQGNVPPWFTADSSDSATKYRDGIDWKRKQFKKHNRTLIKLYHYQWKEDTMNGELERQLQEHHVQMRELTTQEVLSRIEGIIPSQDPLKETMLSFISRAKTNGLTMADLNSRLDQGTWTRKQRSFARMMMRVWQEYESLLKQEGMMDFGDMINYALQVVKHDGSEVRGQYSHILVDEFQDITDPQLELIKRLSGDQTDGKETSLFCVGDDWQNIFSFAGSDVRNIIDFERHFPYAEKTTLSTNYRCPSNIIEVSTLVANLNTIKVDKKVVPAFDRQCPIRLVEKPTYGSNHSYEEWEFWQAKALVEELVAKKKATENIMVLARFNRSLSQLKLEFPNYEDERVEFRSIHKAKGTEADYVLLLGCVKGRNGFPSDIASQRLLEIVEKSREQQVDALEEERRLFYVALTRCRKQLFLFTSKDEKSRFISEIEPYLTAATSHVIRSQHIPRLGEEV
jgi:DNA helicase-4